MTTPLAPSTDRRSLWIVEDDERFGSQLSRLINMSEGFVCEHVFRACEPALEMLRQDIPPDILLMDIGLPGMNGIQGVSLVKAIAPTVQVVMLTVYEDSDSIFDAIGAGAVGYLHKGSSLEDLVNSLRSMLNGGAPINPQIAKKVLDLFSRFVPRPGDYGLTVREKEVLGLLVEGLAKKQIADQLYISFNTVDKHVRNIYGKLQVQTRSGVVAKALKERLL